jgi:hypothetical protein
MRKISVTAILVAGICVAGIKTAAAADFYWIGSSDMEHITILDPSTISASQSGHKTFHLADISTFTLWTDTTIEVDCGGNQMRMTSIINHLAGGDAMDLSSFNKDVNVWHTLVPGAQLNGADLIQTRDLVCKYPDQKPTGDQVMSFPNFQAAMEAISKILTDKREAK